MQAFLEVCKYHATVNREQILQQMQDNLSYEAVILW